MPETPTPSLIPDGYDGRFRAFGTVLESPEHGPQLCHAVLSSYPPQCGGPPVHDWDWSAVAHESAAGTRWGSYLVVGTFDGTAFTLTEPAAPDDGSRPRPTAPAVQFGTPCPEPPGGWRPVDPRRTTRETLQEAIAVAQAADGHGGLWVDQPSGPAPSGEHANDPSALILNVTTTADVRQVYDAVRAVWGGALCVSPAARDEATLQVIQREMSQEAGVMSSGMDVTTGQLVVQLFLATAQRQRAYDERYGAGTVRLEGILAPID